jgi:cytochrome c peroxidase
MKSKNRITNFESLLVLFAGIVVFLFSCEKFDSNFETTAYEIEAPSHFPKMIIPAYNPMTVEGIALGRKLFYDKLLSLDNSISCASCHDQKTAFTDPRQYSLGVNGTPGDRNSMALINLGYQKFFFWDGRSKTLEEQILEPVPNPVEMHLNWDEAVQRISSSEYYRDQFNKIFKATKIEKEHVAKAIAQFLRTLISGTSKFDVMYKIENSLSLSEKEKLIENEITPAEWAGYDLFKSLNGADCFHCHNGPMMQVEKYSNNGLDANPTDFGRELVTKNPNDRAKFKVPTLRNIALTAPYMHDGRFATLDDVIEHYSTGIHLSPTIDPLIEFANQGGVQLDAEQKGLLKAFLLTLTDYEFISNPDFADPN